MGGNYEKSIYNQLMEVIARLDVMENSLHNEKREHKKDVDQLNKKTDSLTQENRTLKEDNACLRSITNNDSSNTSLLPSTDQKCNVHIIRYLHKNTGETGNPWTGEMASLLCGMNKHRKDKGYSLL